MQVDFTKCRLTKCPLAIRPNFTSTCSEEYRQLGSLSVLLTLPSQTDMHSNPNPDLNNDATQTQSWIQKTGSSHGIFLDAYQNSASVQVHAFQDKRAERGEGKSSRQVEIEWKSAHVQHRRWEALLMIAKRQTDFPRQTAYSTYSSHIQVYRQEKTGVLRQTSLGSYGWCVLAYGLSVLYCRCYAWRKLTTAEVVQVFTLKYVNTAS